MEWRKHYDLKEKHAFLSPSSYHWTNYTPEKLAQTWVNKQKVEEGTVLHAFASVAINKGIKLANHKKALNKFVNDAIGFSMESELVLYYSDNCFGTADAIQWYPEEHLLRVHDLKTGDSKASFKQLYVYVALFCLEYKMDPRTFESRLRIYQWSDWEEVVPDPQDILDIMHTIVESDEILNNLKTVI